MENIGRRVWREVRAMTRREVITRAITGTLSWVQAAEIIGITARHMRRIRWVVEKRGMAAVMDQRGGRPRRRRIRVALIRELVRLKRQEYADFSVQHFYEQVCEKRELKVSYNWVRLMLQEAGVVEKAATRGRYRRQRERRPMVGMLVHLDASTHEWITGLPMQDLVVALDDADGRILYAQFFGQEGTESTFAALKQVLLHYGRFCALYSDRGSHFCLTRRAGEAPAEEQNGQVAQALRALGIQQILARSPQARGRSERAFLTIQGRLPQELRLKRIASYEAANRYLEQVFIADFNRRFSVAAAQTESAFVRVGGIDLELVLSTKHQRTVRNDNTVAFKNLSLQLHSTRHRLHFVRCPVLVHELVGGHLAVSYQGQLLARYDRHGALLQSPSAKVGAAAAHGLGRRKDAVPVRAEQLRTPTQIPQFSAHAPAPDESVGEKLLLGEVPQ